MKLLKLKNWAIEFPEQHGLKGSVDVGSNPTRFEDNVLIPEPLPFLTPDLPGVGGVLKDAPEDFLVEEIPAYEPSGEGEHLFLWLEKRDVSAEELERHLARVLDVSRSEIGMAGLKDRRAVTRQYVSVPIRSEAKLENLESAGIRVLRFARHRNKLKTGHLKGNRFSILLRDASPEAFSRCEQIAERLRGIGFPNYYGEQRFGQDGNTLRTGFQLLAGEITKQKLLRSRGRSFLRLALSAVQSELFNRALAMRVNHHSIHRVVLGDVMQVTASGGLFVTEDAEAGQKRFDAGEIVTTGPIFGPKMRKPQGEPGLMESEILEESGLNEEHFRRFSKLTPGGRRAYLIRPTEFQVNKEPAGIRFEFTLPAGCYATMLLREFQKLEN